MNDKIRVCQSMLEITIFIPFFNLRILFLQNKKILFYKFTYYFLTIPIRNGEKNDNECSSYNKVCML